MIKDRVLSTLLLAETAADAEAELVSAPASRAFKYKNIKISICNNGELARK